MNCRVTIKFCAAIAMMLLLSACAGTPKIFTWSSPNTVALEQVYNAAMIAGTDNGFNVYNQDRSSGLITLIKDEPTNELPARRMSVKIKQVGDKITVSTKMSGYDFTGGAARKVITGNFYDYLFRELKITDPKLQNVIVEDAY